MKNNLTSLNNYLFEELERLNGDDALGNENQLEKELKRAEAITDVTEFKRIIRGVHLEA